jgi:hypothetical protein
MYREAAQWREIRRLILEKGRPKKQVCRDTGISRKTINKMLMHENPPGYGPRPRCYPQLVLSISEIVQHLRRKEGFTGSYDSVFAHR